MADILREVMGQFQKRFRDMGDDTHAEVVALGSAAGVDIGNVDVASVALPSALYAGQTVVVSAGTAVALAASQALVSGVRIKAKSTNSGAIYVGNDGVSSSNGFILAAGDEVFIEIADLASVYIDAATNGDGVSYVGS